MKILVAYDGSDCADAALNDLTRAGLPESGQFLVLCAAEVVSPFRKAVALGVLAGTHTDSTKEELQNQRRLDEAGAIAESAVNRLRCNFPKWEFETEVLVASPSDAIIQMVDRWQPDLLVVGSHGLSGFKRFTLGSVSEHVLNHTSCSIRIGRCHMRSENHPIRLVVGTDGSLDAQAALKAVASRQWPAGTEVRVVGVADSRSWLLTSAASIPETMCMPAVKNELEELATDAGKQALEQLKTDGMKATSVMCDGNPAQILIAEAERWNADCIVVGARGLNALARVLVGSVSHQVALNAHCSVEVVRHKDSQ